MMKEGWRVYLLAGTVHLVLSGSVGAEETRIHQAEMQSLYFPKQQITIRVEVADNRAAQAIGLMNRSGLKDREGMWFVFQAEAVPKVWMKNMRFPLDILFVSGQGKIVSHLKNVPPCKQADCPVYSSSVPAKYMLELNAGFIDRTKIEIGDALLRPSVKEP